MSIIGPRLSLFISVRVKYIEIPFKLDNYLQAISTYSIRNLFILKPISTMILGFIFAPTLATSSGKFVRYRITSTCDFFQLDSSNRKHSHSGSILLCYAQYPNVVTPPAFRNLPLLIAFSFTCWQIPSRCPTMSNHKRQVAPYNVTRKLRKIRNLKPSLSSIK
ncbi:hypothetical protein FGO68_gene12136 [Halteria grandinella]|uniref:Uncharacterized protein n=1 Tax=Halteria grandinella TaxID=5974 RepID=A0A8J8T8X8_HALGN|nr:hypothetical protein FGO68_gene12136 [Halteria grandinella]